MSRARIGFLATTIPALTIAAFEFFRHRLLEHQLPGLSGNILGALLVYAGTAWFINYFIRVVRQTEADLGRSRSEAAVLAERQRIAREMHDRVAQSLFHLRVRLEEVDRLAEQGAVGAVRSELEALQGQIGEAYTEVRTVIADLKQNSAVEDTVEALRRSAAKVAREAGVEVVLQLGTLPPLGADAQSHLTAIISEAIANARRHGGATTITIKGDAHRLVIADNGSGFDRRLVAEGGFGLLIMEERALMIGAALHIASEPGHGTRITLQWGARA